MAEKKIPATTRKTKKKGPSRQSAALLGAKHSARVATRRVVKDTVKGAMGNSVLSEAVGCGLSALITGVINKIK